MNAEPQESPPNQVGLMPVAAAKSLAATTWARRWLALITFIVVVAVVGLATSRLADKYEATAYMLINPTHSSASAYEETQASQALLTTFSQLVGTENLANVVRDDLRKNGSTLGIGNPSAHITAEAVSQSQLLKLIATAGSARAAQVLANTYAKALSELTGGLATTNAVAGRAAVAEPATLPGGPSGPNRKLYIFAGIILGLLAGLGVAVMADSLDRRLPIDDDSVELLGLPILGRLQTVTPAGLDALAGGRSSEEPSARAAAESFRLLLANISFVNHGHRPESIAVVSAGGRDGKTTCALGLTHAAAEVGVATLLVEGDMRRPTIADRLHMRRNGGPGFSSVLSEQDALDDAAKPIDGSSAMFLQAGPLPALPGSLLAGEALDIFEREAKTSSDLVVYDTPPLSIGADASLIAAHAQATILVVEARKTNRRLATQTVEQLKRSRARILGVVINRAPHVPLPPGY
jgi:capsular exopolysaccharide synthesis family protein